MISEELLKRLVAIRQHIHAHPEISEAEHETTAFLREKLAELDVRILDKDLSTGLIAEIGQGLPIIALRCDIDALPIVEKTGLSYAATNGAMHACGHDFHQTSLLGAAEILKAREKELKGTLRLFFQPAEEVSKGAYQFIEAGALEGVSAVLGYHNFPQLKPGQIGLKAKAIMAGVEKFKVTVDGVSGHAARPDFGVDTVLTITTMVNNLQALVSRTVSPLESAVLSVTHIEVGSSWNVLPQTGFFEGTIRTFTPELKSHMRERFTRTVESVAAQFGSTTNIHWDRTPNVTFNDETLTPLVAQTSSAFAQVIEVEPSMAGEDFAAYQEQVPGVFALIGSNGKAGAPDLHHDTYTVDDATLPIAIQYYVDNALMLLDYFSEK